ncbi:Tol-Pal system beta propeller repeat protein TolB [Pseudoduganella sp. GCM10020061]|uniref:Tol-Pal system beta propeller repeat protein TolB n=1 Tax=Pseudoduganella sp. GCM10020061 TaxID=3317345 RepID=UPI0036449BF2
MNFAKGLILCGAIVAASANAQLRFEISGVGSTQIPVAVASFADEAIAPAIVSNVIKADLERSGVFKVIDAGRVISETSAVDYNEWKARGARALVVGSVSKLADGRYDVRYKLLDAVNSGELSSMGQSTAARYTRLAAHKIADDIYEKLTGVRGAFATRIAYVNENRANRLYKLEVADADGEGTQVAVTSNEPIISPSWSPDGTKVAYVSFEQKKPIIYVQDLVTGGRRVVVNQKGNNSAPAWSPDGSKLAVALSRDNHTQIYVVNADGSGLRRVSNSAGIDTEPQFSSDGQYIYFTSDRSGGPQIYRMPATGGNATRVTFNGNYNTSPRVSSDGKTLAWVSLRNGDYGLYAMDLATGQELRLADNATEPSFSPNGKYIMYATEAGRRKTLAVVSVDGRVKQRLTTNAGTIREPNWGPFMK